VGHGALDGLTGLSTVRAGTSWVNPGWDRLAVPPRTSYFDLRVGKR